MLSIGQHCEYCGYKDFLPFVCDKCGKTVCGDHRESHACEGAPTALKKTAPRTTAPSPKTTKAKSAQAASAQAASARASAQTSARASPQAPSRAAPSTEALSALSKLKGLVGSRRLLPKVVKVDPLAELKRDAKGDAKVALQDRVYLRIKRPAQKYKDVVSGTEKVRPEKTLALYFAKSTLAGKVRDSACTALGVKSSELVDGSTKIAANCTIDQYSGKTLVLA